MAVAPRADRVATASARLPECVRLATVFQDDLLEQPPTASAPASVRQRAATLTAQARAACHGCPLLTDCLYRAVVDFDVAGFVAGTTERQRSDIRRRLNVRVQPEDLDALAGVVGGRGPVDHAEVLRLRRAHPDDSLDRLAVRLGCSLSTVKRHLRRERQTRQQPVEPVAPAPRPSLDAVLDAASLVLVTKAEPHAA